MRTKYTTSFSGVDDRFEFSRKGIFNCRIKHEYLICIVLTVVTGLLWSSLFGYIFGTEVTMNNSLFMSVIGLVVYALLLVIPFLYIGVFRTILSGEIYSYTLDNEKMLITCPRRNFRADIFVQGVRRVEYEEIKLFGKTRGYTVKIICTDGECNFDFLFPQEMKNGNIDMTPFRKLEERAGLLERPDYYMGQMMDNMKLK